ncbi:MAG: phage major capsid protein [Candidatus Paracaedibacteraceae bacterium]|nr:phage major capsid protein [Candidatus Paracaedibacteraceae bacterium]
MPTQTTYDQNEFINDLSDIKTSVADFHDRQEKKLNQLWTAVGRMGESKMDTTTVEDDALRGFMRSGLQTKGLSSQDETGAFLVARPVQDHIQQRLMLNGGIRSLARSTSISTDAIELLIDKKSGDAGWVSETGDRNETAVPELFKHKISVHEMYAKPRISQKMLDDAAIDIESWLIDKVSHKMHQLENTSFVHGDGVGKPKGFLTYPKVAVGNGEWGVIESVKTGFDGIIQSIDVLFDVIESMKPELLDGAVWYVARSAVTQLRRLKTQDGLPIWQPSLLAKEPDMLLGYPVVLSDDMPPAREGEPSTSMVFANFKRGYQVIDRHEMRLLRDPYSSKPFVEFYATKRVGGDVIDFDAFKAISFSA